ncbi:pre-miRNA 5'-monophosphate methyltransferase [Polyodon spathula]|uniref:pre-miRNA 5'-monophosphate methyltransferase n=1 Tax=Polyodon spathula TaxID=7913 RepID=UPI001B7EEC2C|nr:pre-miRNA 5'-monophosphate methyltransferase [Polyodon spathula]
MAVDTGNVNEEGNPEIDYSDPGAALFGNFINYYSFNPPENRLSLIPASLLQELGYSRAADRAPLLMLDVGCNSGDLSIALYRHLLGLEDGSSQPGAGGALGGRKQLHLLGCDLDETLIQRAQEGNPFPETVTFLPLDITDRGAREEVLGSYLARCGRPAFDLCACLAVTMWVHLNHGDQGLLELLSSLAALCHHLLLEAQPWRCYRSAARRLRRAGRTDFEHFKQLRVRGVLGIRGHLESRCGMKLVRSFGHTAWGRSLLLFRRCCPEEEEEPSSKKVKKRTLPA